MLDKAKLTLSVVVALIVGAVSGAWSLRGEVVTQTQLGAAMTALDSRLLPIAGQVTSLSDKLAAVGERLAKLEGRLDSSGQSRPPS